MQTVQHTQAVRRHDIYSHIHKALRAMMADTVVRLGSLDSFDDQEVADVMSQVQALCTFTESHLQHEDNHVHPAMEKVRPGSASTAATEHPQHVAECRQLVALSNRVLQSGGDARAALAAQLYHEVSLFMAESLEHMHMEETENNRVLWAGYSDQQLFALEMEIVATLTPAEHGMTLQWMIPSMTPQERLGMLGGAQKGVPVQVFVGMMEGLRQYLDAHQWQRLADGLGYESPLLAA